LSAIGYPSGPKAAGNCNRDSGALQVLKPALKHPDLQVDLAPYGTEFAADEIIEIPEADLPPGIPPWMRRVKNWAARTGKTPALKSGIPVLKHGTDSSRVFGRVATGGTFGLGGMGDLSEGDIALRAGGTGFPNLPSVSGQSAESDNGFDIVGRESSFDPPVPVSDNALVILVAIAASLAEDAIKERIDH
jgi:hypothetical protein